LVGDDLSIEIKEGVKLYPARAFRISKSREELLKKEYAQSCKLGVLKQVNYSEWSVLASIIPKKDGSVRFISDFRELNKRIKHKPFPIPTIQDLTLEIDLTIGNYHIELNLMLKSFAQ